MGVLLQHVIRFNTPAAVALYADLVHDVGLLNGDGQTAGEVLARRVTDLLRAAKLPTPLSECGILGTAAGMALYGMRAVPEIQFLDFIYPGFDQIVSEAAKMRYRSGGEYTSPMVIRSPYGDFRPPVARASQRTPGLTGLSQRSRSKVGSILFTLAFVAIFLLILVQAAVSVVTAGVGH